MARRLTWTESARADADDHATHLNQYSSATSAGELPVEEIDSTISASREVSLTKSEVLQALDDLPDPCTMGEILHTLSVRERIKQGIWSLENEPTFTQEEVEQSLSRWLIS